MSENSSFPSGSSKIISIGLLGKAVPLNFITSPGSNFRLFGAMIIFLSVSTVHDFKMFSLPSVIVALYLPNGVSNGMMIGSVNSQFPLESTSAVLELMISPSGFVISAVTAPLGFPVPEISKKSPL